MKRSRSGLGNQVIAHAAHSLLKHHAPRIEYCLRMLSEKDIWWRPNANSNSIGNLVLQLNGNVRQWIISGLGGKPFARQRDKEFSERGPVPRRQLIATLRATVREASCVIQQLTDDDFPRRHAIQGYRATGLVALLHVTEHFALHTGQITSITKQRTGKDLGFTRLPGEKRKKTSRRRLPTL
jgi:hypothetical protein